MEMSKKERPSEQLKAYINACFAWPAVLPHHAKWWLHFLFQCSFDADARELNSSLVEVGYHRLTGLIQNGLSQGEFKIKDPSRAALAIQIQITGALQALVTENPKKEKNMLIQSVHLVAQKILALD